VSILLYIFFLIYKITKIHCKIANEKNRKYLDLLERGLFVINLEDALDITDLTDTGRRNAAALRVMHGCGYTKGFTANRWFDSIVQVILYFLAMV
jgi:hypothetical protein